jgi:hypothetical protein
MLTSKKNFEKNIFAKLVFFSMVNLDQQYLGKKMYKNFLSGFNVEYLSQLASK